MRCGEFVFHFRFVSINGDIDRLIIIHVVRKIKKMIKSIKSGLNQIWLCQFKKRPENESVKN